MIMRRGGPKATGAFYPCFDWSFLSWAIYIIREGIFPLILTLMWLLFLLMSTAITERNGDRNKDLIKGRIQRLLFTYGDYIDLTLIDVHVQYPGIPSHDPGFHSFVLVRVNYLKRHVRRGLSC